MNKPMMIAVAAVALVAGLVLAPVMNLGSVEGSHFRDRWLGSHLKLSFANVAIDIPLMKGYYDGEELFFIATESSDRTHADLLTRKTGWKVVEAP